jgi:hypothetical protein
MVGTVLQEKTQIHPQENKFCLSFKKEPSAQINSKEEHERL